MTARTKKAYDHISLLERMAVMPRFTTRIIEGPTTRSSPYRAATREQYVYRVETPCSEGSTPIRSVWPTNPALKRLTNARIRRYELDGKYGPDAQRAALARLTEKQAAKRRTRQNKRFLAAVMEKYV
jgi:hypothetical protein